MERAMKRRSVVNDEQDVNRLSALPDGVICHILSFMPTKLSMKTSILAKRWRFLWAHVPILDLKAGKSRSQRTSFGGIVCALMLRHKAERLNTLRLKCTDYDDEDDVLTDGDDDAHTGRYELETCIYTAIERNVQNLDLFIDVELPVCLLTCKTLVNLRIGGGVTIPSSGSIYLPRLKKLYFEPPDYDVHFPRLVSGCPVIEELIIDEAACFDLKDCTISSPTLKSLTFNFLMYGRDSEFRLEINAPALRYLKVHGDRDLHLSVALMNLIEADICIGNDDSCLRLSGYQPDISNVPGSIVKFGSLTKLWLTANWCFLTMFLEGADNLQELIIYEGYRYSKGWVDPIEEGCLCLLHSLRIVRIDDFTFTEQGFNFVSYILRNAQVLEQMEIYCGLEFDLQKKYNAIQRISTFYRGSKKCKLDFS